MENKQQSSDKVHSEPLQQCNIVRGTFSYTNYANENFIEENKIVKCYTLKSKSKKPRIIYVSLKKPKRDKCAFIDCAKLTPFGISSDKIDNWNDLPSEVPYDAEHFKTYYYDGVEIRFV